MKKVLTFVIVFIMSFMFMKGNVFAAFSYTLESSSGQTAKYKITSSIKYTNVTAEPGVGIASANLVWNADGLTGTLDVEFSSSDCKGEVRLKYDASQGCSSSTPKNCQAIIDDARSMIGKIPYEMGGKCWAMNYEQCLFGRKYTDWNSYTKTIHQYRPWSTEKPVSSNYKRYENSYALTGLDCSGYVWWIYYRNGYDLAGYDSPRISAGYSGVPNLTSGSKIVHQITKEEAQPCDLVTSKKPGYGNNIPHIGIVSQNAAGGGWQFIHENGSDANVSENCYFDCEAPGQGKAVLYWRVDTLWDGESDETSETCSGYDVLQLDNSEYCSCKNCDEVKITKEYIDGDSVINNCCLEGDSHIKEYFISQLFCSTEDQEVKMSYYTEQCKAELYLDDVLKGKVDENYCKIYCVEEMDLKTPDQIQSATGKFFKLAELDYTDLDGNPQKTKAPVISGSKICTIRINYLLWRQDYQEIIGNEVRAFNAQQENLAYYELYKDASKEVKDLTQEITINCTAKSESYRKKSTKAAKGSQYTTSSGGTATCNSDSGCDDYESYYETKCEKVECTNKYTQFTVTTGGKTGISCSGGKCNAKYYNVKENASFADGVSFNGLKLETIEKTATVNQVTAYPYSNGCDSAVSDKISAESGSWTCTAASSGKEIPDDLSKLDMDAEATKYKKAANDETDALVRATTDAQILEDAMLKCQNFFEDGGDGAESKDSHDTSDNFKLKPSATFNYIQVYLDGKTPASGWTEIDYGNATCDYRYKNEGVKDIECPDGGTGCIDEYYSPKKFKSGVEDMEDLTDIRDRVTSPAGIIKDTVKTYDKKLRQDAEYDAQCVWNDPEIPDEVTLYPGPLVDKYDTHEGSIMISRHKYQYAVYVVTYATKYETYWNIKDIGGSERTKDKFIKAFNDAKGTCATIEVDGETPAYSDGGAEESSSDSIKPTCVMEVLDGGMRIGTCQTGVGDIDELCHENIVKEVFEFRVVDPRDMFPGDWSDKAANWKTNSGAWGPTYNTIKDIALQDKTYSPENLSYAFKLDSKSIKAIKNYNSGTTYDDFNLTCDCPAEDDIDVAGCGTIDDDVKPVNGHTECLTPDGKWKYTCRNCHSAFLKELADDGEVGGTSINGPAWNNSKKTFTQIRNDKTRWA